MTDDPVLDLVLAAGAAKSREEWLFLLVNRSVGVVGYDRASAWSASGRFELLAVSGQGVPDGDGAFASAWRETLKRSGRPERAVILAAETPAGTALWIPVPDRDVLFAFERWDGDAPAGADAASFTASFAEAERARLERLVAAASLAWSGGGKRVPVWTRKRTLRLGVPVLALLTLALVRLPLRIAAECEVAAKNPRLVAAPMDGVIEEVTAVPGQRVEAGTLLAVYDSRMMEEELNVLRRQAGVVEAELATARARGFTEQSFRAETSRLEARLEQERARLRALEARYAQRAVAAPVGGMVQLDDPRAWRGRPVATGQAILWIVEPSETRLKIWLPQDDRIDFDPERLVGVHLYALGGEARTARLTYVSTYARAAGGGRSAFPAEAEWAEEKEPPPLGLRGTAFLYGDDVSLGYWLVRRPLGWIRRWIGI